jgi:hypothetical protein
MARNRKGKVIRIDEDLWEVLKAKAIPLEDTPSSVLRKIFQEYGLLRKDMETGQHKERNKK